MLTRRVSWHGLFAVLLALMSQLAIGAIVPHAVQASVVVGAEPICHTADASSGAPATPAPMHPLDCAVCPLCVALHAPAMALSSPAPTPTPPQVLVVLRGELPPPSTAPPAPHRPLSQPRAPPTLS